ncbi:MAG: hypothetical protein NC253_11155 [Ruminococcus sp.]|nr:hypothetical protein [Ruminococcus sp.]MCM1380295.1 hypothetical protein [Muribaculaceae bacterium]MCM1478275.1 hypothetical protein [Muribaculaceae bacterium]
MLENNTLEILPDTSIKINGTPVKANIISIKPAGTRGQFCVKMEMCVLLTAEPPEYDLTELETTGQVLIKS